jgi:hypothetical protein
MVLLVFRNTLPLVSSFALINAHPTLSYCSVLGAGPHAALAAGPHRRVLMHYGHVPHRGH